MRVFQWVLSEHSWCYHWSLEIEGHAKKLNYFPHAHTMVREETDCFWGGSAQHTFPGKNGLRLANDRNAVGARWGLGPGQCVATSARTALSCSGSLGSWWCRTSSTGTCRSYIQWSIRLWCWLSVSRIAFFSSFFFPRYLASRFLCPVLAFKL